MINGHHSSHIMVTAEVVSVGLELSCHHITLTPLQGMPAQSGSYFFLFERGHMLPQSFQCVL